MRPEITPKAYKSGLRWNDIWEGRAASRPQRN